jgi:hypothetical protein
VGKVGMTRLYEEVAGTLPTALPSALPTALR